MLPPGVAFWSSNPADNSTHRQLDVGCQTFWGSKMRQRGFGVCVEQTGVVIACAFVGWTNRNKKHNTHYVDLNPLFPRQHDRLLRCFLCVVVAADNAVSILALPV